MSGDADDTSQHSPRTRGIIQHFERQVRVHAKHLDEDVRVTNERLGQLETAQIDTNTKLASLESSLRAVNISLAGIMDRLERMDQNGRDGSGPRNSNNHNTVGSVTGEDDVEYSADTELDEEVNGNQRRQQRRNRYGTGAHPPRREVRADDSFGKIKFTIPSFDGKYNPDTYLTWELAIDQKFTCQTC
jgi:hypothetical protein